MCIISHYTNVYNLVTMPLASITFTDNTPLGKATDSQRLSFFLRIISSSSFSGIKLTVTLFGKTTVCSSWSCILKETI